MSAHPVNWVRELGTIPRRGGELDQRLTERGGATTLSDLLCPTERPGETFILRGYDERADREIESLQASAWLLQGSDLAHTHRQRFSDLLASPKELGLSEPHNQRVNQETRKSAWLIGLAGLLAGLTGCLYGLQEDPITAFIYTSGLGLTVGLAVTMACDQLNRRNPELIRQTRAEVIQSEQFWAQEASLRKDAADRLKQVAAVKLGESFQARTAAVEQTPTRVTFGGVSLSRRANPGHPEA
ncbi:MAG: hypothetical protein AMXMBFR33_33230 [Candidatus Xenobia bacterium]